MISKHGSDSFHRSTLLQRPRLSFCESNVKALSAWIASFPLQKLGDAAEAVLQALDELLQLDCAETLRFDLLQVLHPTVEHVVSALEQNFIHHDPHYSDRQNHLIELQTCIQLYFTHLYMQIAYRSDEQLSQVKRSLLNLSQHRNLKTARILACYFALQQQTLLLIQQQKRYVPTFVDQWLHTHALYRLACENDEQLININLLQGSHYPLEHIQHAYMQVLLLDIFNTHQIRPIEIQALFYCSAQWVKWIEVSQQQNHLSRYMVDTLQDLPPSFNQKQRQISHADLFLSTQNLLEHINSTIQHDAKYMSEIEKKYLTTALQFHIQNVLGTNHAERRYQRYEYSAQLELCFSVQTANFYLSQQADLTLPTTSSVSSSKSESELSPNHVFNDLHIPLSSELDREALQRYTAQVLDISSHGYRIHWPHERPKRLSTGEFILLREHANQAWKFGVIRWMKLSVLKSYAIGLEVIAGSGLACTLHMIQHGADHSTIQHGLILMQLDQADFTLILSNVTDVHEHKHWALQLSMPESEQHAEPHLNIDLGKIVRITPSFVQFDFKTRLPAHTQLLQDRIYASKIKK